MDRKPRKKHRFLKFLLVLTLIFGVLVYDSNTRLVTDEFTLGSARLPEAFRGFRIVQLSDLHAARFGKENAKLVDAVREAAPDIIVITGDMVDAEGQRAYVEELIPQLTALAPVYFVSGNHEWASGWARELFKLLEDLDVTVLRNEYVTFGRGGDYIVIGGVDDPNGLRDQKSPEEVVEELRAEHPGKYVLMLAHRDTELDMWADLQVDAVLCGHAHGGLVRLPFTDGLVAPGQGLLPTYTAGIYQQGGTQMLVSRGLGGTRPIAGLLPAPRLFNNPEVVLAVLDLG